MLGGLTSSLIHWQCGNTSAPSLGDIQHAIWPKREETWPRKPRCVDLSRKAGRQLQRALLWRAPNWMHLSHQQRQGVFTMLPGETSGGDQHCHNERCRDAATHQLLAAGERPSLWRWRWSGGSCHGFRSEARRCISL